MEKTNRESNTVAQTSSSSKNQLLCWKRYKL